MSHRLVYIGIIGMLLAGVGLAAMLYPIFLDQYDGYGIRVNCGNGLTTGLSEAIQPDGPFATQCGSARLARRLWAIPTIAIGWLLVTGYLVKWAHEQRKNDEDAEPQHYVPHPEIAGPTTGSWHVS